ncbi:hypothetical protein Pan181_20570 [Aeoliella mucimassa]|uniref:Uncharacterized protein n=1 Tax=Aeoliella mucimassa TaxID=2527972 RepID=A0A518AMB0_9BACT|nr:hypothetical protein Pan181_20570 [Aeoliella mucimassa]
MDEPIVSIPVFGDWSVANVITRAIIVVGANIAVGSAALIAFLIIRYGLRWVRIALWARRITNALREDD